MRKAPRRFNIAFVLSQTEFTIFDSWWQDGIQGGERKFDIQLLDEDDADDLIWYTVNVIGGVYDLNVTQAFDYEVSFEVRAVDEGFTDRPSGTDTLGGRLSMGMQQAHGNLLVFTPYIGSTSFGITYARAVPNLPPLRGSAGFYFRARARPVPLPFRGGATFTVQATGYFDPASLNFYPELSRQWQRLGWMRPLATQDINTSQDYTSREWMEI
jgi:hypothetical protein